MDPISACDVLIINQLGWCARFEEIIHIKKNEICGGIDKASKACTSCGYVPTKAELFVVKMYRIGKCLR